MKELILDGEWLTGFRDTTWRNLERLMACKSCGSERRAELRAEINIHVPDGKGLDESGVWVFPKLEVCLVCGRTQFTIPESKLNQLESATAA